MLTKIPVLLYSATEVKGYAADGWCTNENIAYKFVL